MAEMKISKTQILVIDDDSNTRDFLSLELGGLGYRVRTACRGSEALEIFSHDPVDLVISDLMMPQMNGLQILEEIKAKSAETPVIFITGYGDVELAVQAMKKGASDFILKPFKIPEITARMEKSLEVRDRYRAFKNQMDEMKQVFDSLDESRNSHLQSEKLAMMGRLVSGIAHEINNPLTAVIGYAQLLLDTEGKDMRRQLGVIKEQAQRCGKIIQDLMLFSQKRKPQMQTLDSCEPVESAMEAVKTELEARNIQVLFSKTPEKIFILGDRNLLKKVFVNLILNAAQALEKKKNDRTLEIRILDKKEQVQIEIQDNGTGIVKENLCKVFDPFFTTKEVGKGSGLGLSLCHGLVAEHGGRIWVESVMGQGALFSVLLPKQESAVSSHR